METIDKLKKMIESNLNIISTIKDQCKIIPVEEKQQTQNLLHKIKVSLTQTEELPDTQDKLNLLQEINTHLMNIWAYLFYKYGDYTLEGVGRLLNVTRERVRQIEYNALYRLRIVLLHRKDDYLLRDNAFSNMTNQLNTILRTNLY